MDFGIWYIHVVVAVVDGGLYDEAPPSFCVVLSLLELEVRPIISDRCAPNIIANEPSNID